MAYSQSYDVAIIGGGIAGLSVALRLPAHLRVALFTVNPKIKWVESV